MDSDCYLLLGIPPDADEETIRRAYRAKAKEIHPDVNPSPEANTAFNKLRQALEILTDPGKRHAHDSKFGYHKHRKKGDHNLYQINDGQSQKAQTNIRQWEQSQAAQMAAAERRKKELLEEHRKKRKRVLAVSIITLAGLTILALLLTR